MSRATQALIDLGALRHNFELVRQYAPASKVMPVIKTDAYGHGMVQVANALSGADAFAVAILEEAVALRDSGVDIPVTVLQGVTSREEFDLAQRLRLDLVVHQLEQIELLEKAESGQPLVIWLKLDTGMHRMGILLEQFQSAYQRLQSCASVAEIRLMSHFACADDTGSAMTERQCSAFDSCTAEVTASKCLANSAAIMAWPDTHRDWVRPGIMLYGASPMLNWRSRTEPLQPVMTLRSTIIGVKEIAAGEAVGYGADWVADKPSRIATVAIGYGDGYPRALASGTPVLVKDNRVSLVGRVSMDSITLDVTGLPDVQVGDSVTLWGEGLPVEEIAEQANTIAYELLCQVSQRVPRDFVAI